MSKIKNTPEGRLDEFISVKGIKALNLIIERHHLANEKRTWFTIRFATDNPQEEKEHTENMKILDEKIGKIDNELICVYKVGEKLRTQIIRDVKKIHPNDWMSGFVE